MKGSGDKKIGFLDLHKNIEYLNAVIDALCGGTGNSEHKLKLKNILEYVAVDKYHLFNRVEFTDIMYEDDLLNLILPAIRRIYGQVFIDPPSMLINNPKRLELFHILFDIDDFINYMIDMIPKCSKSLEHFTNLDRASETLKLIVDNYIAGMFEKTRVSDYKKVIRDLKIDKITK